MSITDLLLERPYIDMPANSEAWVGWVLLLLVLISLSMRWRGAGQEITAGRLVIFLVLILLAIPATLFLRLELPFESGLPIPGLPVEPQIPTSGILFALPFVLAAGLLGNLPAMIVGLVSGFSLAFWGTHNLFTPLEVAGLSLLFSVCLRQRYRTPGFRLLRNPLVAAMFLAVAYLPGYALTAFLATSGSLAVRLDYAFTQTWMVMIVRGVELILAGGLAEFIHLLDFRWWGERSDLQPSPMELSLQTRFLTISVSLVFVALISLLFGNWIVAGNAAQRMIRERLESTARTAAEGLPPFLETGQAMIARIAEPELMTLPTSELQERLRRDIKQAPFFMQLILLDEQNKVLAIYPNDPEKGFKLSREEEAGINLAFKQIPTQTFTVNDAEDRKPPIAWICFMAAVKDESGNVKAVLLGRTDFAANSFTQSVLKSLDSLTAIGGEGMILDENLRRLYHPNPNLILQEYAGTLPPKEGFFETLSPMGSRMIGFYMPSWGREWSVMVQVPLERAQELALEIAIPMMMILLVVGVVVLSVMWLGLRQVSSSLVSLSREARLIAEGKLDHKMKINSDDEVGRFSRAFEMMRLRLKARLEELNRLLVASQGVAKNLTAAEAFQPILQAALVEGASAARAVLVGEVMLAEKADRIVTFSTGLAADQYAYLDEQLFSLLRHQEMIIIPSLSRIRRINVPSGEVTPSSLAVFSLRHESQYFGCLWVAFDQPHNFLEEEVRFLTTLAGEAALAAANARLYAAAEIGRQRLESILEATPDPVMVIDENNRLLVVNPAALQIGGLVTSPLPGRKIDEVTDQAELLELIRAPIGKKTLSREISLPSGRIYFVSVSPVAAEEHSVGKVIILRDITQYKELDTLKSDFVATVSHDLRSPLTLMRGYSSMLGMVGEVNEQQKNYIQKIIASVESMTRLVNNLLDLGRIEAGIGLQVERVILPEVVEQAVQALRMQANQKSQTITVDIPGDASKLEADRALLQQAILNLVENAVKYTPSNGKIHIAAVHQGDAILISVQDTGIGVAPLDLPHLFEKFYRSGRREAYQQRGTGLGLAIVKSIAERHGGRVWVESQLGKGSTFYFLIPMVQAVKSEGEKKVN